MDPFGGVNPWFLILAGVVAAVLLAVVGTWPVCALVLWMYRRRIDRGMRSVARPALADAPSMPPETRSRRIAVREVEFRGQLSLLEQARRRARRSQLLFALLGLGYGLAATAAYHIVDQAQWRPVRVAAYTLLLGWPVLPTLLALSTARRRIWWLSWGIYVAAVATLLVVAGESTTEVLTMAVPMLFVLATSARALRGAAWLVAPGLMVLGLAVAAWWPILVHLRYRAPFDRFAWTLLAIGIGLPVLLVAYGWAIARAYQAKWASDQTLLILQWWFVSALWWTMLLGTQGGLAALLGLAPYALLVLVLFVIALLRRRRVGRPVRLLLLRTFGARERSSRLLHDLTRWWRWIGSVELITAPDLASETLEPDEFLDFMRGRLARRFVTEEALVERRLRELDLRPDRDGRYRVNELLCQDQTWQLALEGMVAVVDAVLIDLRNFSARNSGVWYEVQRLVALLPLAQVVALIDQTTDRDAVQAALARAATRAPQSSPLRTDPDPAFRVVGWDSPSDNVGRLIRALAQAATADQDGTAASGEADQQRRDAGPRERTGNGAAANPDESG